MARQIQFRRGNTAQNAAFTGLQAELTVDTEQRILILHDGFTPGGVKLASEAYVDAAIEAGGGTGGPGSPGPTGPQGVKGDKGDPGTPGIQGIQGAPGPKGDTGDTGVKGDTGAKGDTGDKGNTGDAGPKGDAGPQGIQGEQGLKGDTGDKGDKGDTGAPGADSTVPGPQGNLGPAGPQGNPGIQGVQGNPGLDSTVPGPRGLKGDPGVDGAPGLKGDKGDKGDTGAPGLDAMTGDIFFYGTTIGTVQSNQNIIVTPDGTGELHITANVGIENNAPEFSLQVGNADQSESSGDIGFSFNDGEDIGTRYSNTASIGWSWFNGMTKGNNQVSPKHAIFGMFKGGNPATPWISFDELTPMNAVVFAPTTGDAIFTGQVVAMAGVKFSDGSTMTTAPTTSTSVVSVPATAMGRPGDIAGMVAFDVGFVYYCNTSYTDGLSPIWRRSVMIGEAW